VKQLLTVVVTSKDISILKLTLALHVMYV